MDGSVFNSEKDDLDWLHIWSGSFRRPLPWGKNDLREAWIELRIAGAVYWLEIPYGFTRNPAEPLCQTEFGGVPKLCPAMARLKEQTNIVNWESVKYEFDSLGGWPLVVSQSNGRELCSELTLSGFDKQDLRSCPTAVAIDLPTSDSLVGNCWRITRQGNARSDYFKFNHSRGLGNTRGWGVVVVTVNGATTKVVVPSSTFEFGHGAAQR